MTNGTSYATGYLALNMSMSTNDSLAIGSLVIPNISYAILSVADPFILLPESVYTTFTSIIQKATANMDCD